MHPDLDRHIVDGLVQEYRGVLKRLVTVSLVLHQPQAFHDHTHFVLQYDRNDLSIQLELLRVCLD